ncbi:MAG: metallophosphoesterase [Nanoarchaeota archaeon]
MKFLVFTDIHENRKVLQELVQRAQQDDIHFVVCTGDFSTFGRGADIVLKSFNDLGKKFIVIPGNHEDKEGWLDQAVRPFPNCLNLHDRFMKIDDYLFLGYGGDGFAMEDARFRKVAREWYGKYNGQKLVLLTHGPPFGTMLDRLGNRHVGNKDYRDFIERIKPKLALSGHLHETFGAMDMIGSTRCVNSGKEGMVVELK